MAYHSTGQGNTQVFVRPFVPASPCAEKPSASPRMISTTSGGIFARWSPGGNRLFYLTLNGDLMAVDIVESRVRFQHRAPRPLWGNLAPAAYDVAKDDRFVVVGVPGAPGPPPPFTMVQNWLTRIER